MNDDMLSPQSLSIEPLRRDRIRAISSTVQPRPIVLVLGMHRSGTSLCSHILSALGVDMSDDIDVNPSNARGHWERREIVAFHDRILGHFNRDYLGSFHDFPLPVAWWADPRVAQIRREIVAFLEQRVGDGYFGFKDPRTVRLMPLWQQIFNELKLAPRIVLCLRNPAQVARSLYSRDSLDPEIGEYRWLVHIVDFFRYISKFDFCRVEYEEWFNNPSANIEKLKNFLDLQWQQSEADLALVLSGIIDPALRHDDFEHREANQPLVRSLYELASRAGQDGGARDQIAYIVSQFVSFQQLQRPFQQAFEGVAEIAAKFPEIEQETTALRAVVGERDVGIAAAEGRANAAEARLADAVAEIEEQRVRIADLARERDDANGLRATLAEREVALAELSRRTDELLAARQSLQAALAHAEWVALRAKLAQVEGEATGRGAAAAMEAEVRGLRERLAQAVGVAKDRVTATATLEAEARVLQEKLAQAVGIAKEGVAAVAALQAEIATLQGTLTAARQVGKAAMTALQFPTEAPPKLDRPHRWRSAVMRVFGARASA
jgi:hypothetical protein